MAKRKLKIGTLVGFSFAGQNLMGEIKEITTDIGYSVTTTWYNIWVEPQQGDNGTIYPVRVEDETIKEINSNR